MASQVTAQSFVEQETGFQADEMGNKLQAKSVVDVPKHALCGN